MAFVYFLNKQQYNIAILLLRIASHYRQVGLS